MNKGYCRENEGICNLSMVLFVVIFGDFLEQREFSNKMKTNIIKEKERGVLYGSSG